MTRTCVSFGGGLRLDCLARGERLFAWLSCREVSRCLGWLREEGGKCVWEYRYLISVVTFKSKSPRLNENVRR